MESTITVQLDKSLYFDPVPSSATSFTANAPIALNPYGTYLHENSGTAEFKIKESSEGSFTFSIFYDAILWGRKAGQSFRWDTSAPLMSVSMSSSGTKTTVNMKDAVAAIDSEPYGAGRNNVKVYRNNLSTHIGYDSNTDGRLSGELNDTMILELRGFLDQAGVPYRTFFKELKVVIELPKYTDDNGNAYYMSLDNITSQGAAHYNFRYTRIDDTENGTVTLVYNNIYFVDSYIFGRCHFSFPDIPNLDKGKYPFKGSIRMFRDGVEINQHYTEVVNGKTVPRTSITLFLDNDASANLLALHSSDEQISSLQPDYPAACGYYYLQNNGSRDSGKLTINLDFNEANEKGKASEVLLGITTVALMPDPNQKPMIVRYTLMDETGKVIDNNGQPFTVEVANKYNSYSAFNGLRLDRSMLPAEHRNYYFNSISYDIGYIPAGFYYNNPNNIGTLGSAGNFYGYYLGEEVSANKNSYTHCTVLKADGTEDESLRKIAVTVVRPRTKSRAPIFISNCSFSKEEINAGESFNVTAVASVTANNGGTLTVVEEVWFGVILPDSAVINEQSIVLRFVKTGKTVPVASVSKVKIGEGRNLWTIKAAPNNPIGYQTEDLKELPNGYRMQADFQVNTSTQALEETLYTGNTLLVAGNEIQSTMTSVIDAYDFNANGLVNDNIGSVTAKYSQKSITIWAKSARMEDSEAFTTSKTKENIYSLDDVVNYKVSVKNTKGGTAKNVAYYVQIPQESVGGTSDKLVLAGAGTITHTAGTKIKLLYTTDPDLNYNTVKSMDAAGSITWSETVSDYSKVTMVKAVSADGSNLVNGTDVAIILPLKYSGPDYSKCAGNVATVKAHAVYTYVQGTRYTAYEYTTDSCTITLHYRAPEKVMTLTAALNMQPTAPNVRTDTYATDLSFYKAQNLKVANMKLNNVDLGNYTADQLSANANQRFKVGITMNADTQKTLLADVSMGSLGANTALSFGFELFNGNALTDITTERYITFDLISDHVTIPVRVIINRELAVAGATQSAIIAGKEYLDAGTADAISVSKNSAFTAQFVTPGLNDTNYDARILQFSSALPSGTTIAMLDYTGTTPRYAHYTANGTTKDISLTSFTLMGRTGGYTVNTGSGFTERLIFVVDFSGATSYLAENTYTAKMKVKGNGVADVVSKELKFTTTGIRTFSASVDKTALKYGEDFKVSYTVGAASNDSKYYGRNLALVVDGGSLPSDAYLVAGGTAYYQNSKGQFIVPLTDAQSAGTKSISVRLESDILVNNLQSCTLTAKLWISATTNGEQPHKGSVADTVTVTYSAVTPPSLKVNAMSDRALNPEDLANSVSLTYTTANIPSGAKVTLEVQKLIDAGYVTDSIYLEQVTANAGVSQGVYTVKSSGDTLTLKLSKLLEVGNYQVLMSVVSGDSTLLSVPYRFIVTE